MKWITREKVKVDRVACPWLIKRIIDPDAEFIFVPANEVVIKAEELGATPFDVDGCELGHHGEDVSFNSILKKYRILDADLLLLGEIDLATDAPAPPVDSDQDGMPGSWEMTDRLDPNNPSDGPTFAGNGYTKVENYLNELAGDPVPGLANLPAPGEVRP